MERDGESKQSGSESEPLIEIFDSAGTAYLKKSQILKEDIQNYTVRCTSCFFLIDHNGTGEVMKHRRLNVIVCKKCYDLYGDEEFSEQESDNYKYCSWCGKGGNFYLCDFCPNCFCATCVRRNLGRSEVTCMSKKGWKCYCCDPKKLCKKVAYCNLIQEYNKSCQEEQAKSSEKTESVDVYKVLIFPAFDQKNALDQASQKKMQQLKDIATSRSKSAKQMIKEIIEAVNTHRSELGLLVKGLNKSYTNYENGEKLKNISVESPNKTKMNEKIPLMFSDSDSSLGADLESLNFGSISSDEKGTVAGRRKELNVTATKRKLSVSEDSNIPSTGNSKKKNVVKSSPKLSSKSRPKFDDQTLDDVSIVLENCYQILGGATTISMAAKHLKDFLKRNKAVRLSQSSKEKPVERRGRPHVKASKDVVYISSFESDSEEAEIKKKGKGRKNSSSENEEWTPQASSDEDEKKVSKNKKRHRDSSSEVDEWTVKKFKRGELKNKIAELKAKKRKKAAKGKEMKRKNKMKLEKEKKQKKKESSDSYASTDENTEKTKQMKKRTSPTKLKYKKRSEIVSDSDESIEKKRPANRRVASDSEESIERKKPARGSFASSSAKGKNETEDTSDPEELVEKKRPTSRRIASTSAKEKNKVMKNVVSSDSEKSLEKKIPASRRAAVSNVEEKNKKHENENTDHPASVEEKTEKMNSKNKSVLSSSSEDEQTHKMEKDKTDTEDAATAQKTKINISEKEKSPERNEEISEIPVAEGEGTTASDEEPDKNKENSETSVADGEEATASDEEPDKLSNERQKKSRLKRTPTNIKRSSLRRSTFMRSPFKRSRRKQTLKGM